MQVAMIQMKSVLNDPMGNLDKMMEHIESISLDKEAIVVFPEMVIHGYDFSELPLKIEEQALVLERLRACAITKDICILVGGIGFEESNYYLTQFVITSDVQMYHKIHIGKKESKFVSPGQTIKVFEYKGFKLGVMMCYDTHFPELSTHMALKGADIILAPSSVPNKPESRVENWKKYLCARAYDNRVYVAAVNLISDKGGGGIIVYDDKGDCLDSYSGSDSHTMVFTLKRGTYTGDSMKNRLFTAHRKASIYNQYEKLT